MTKYKAALFDVDGVLNLQPKLFSHIYCESRGIDSNRLQEFYKSPEFMNSSIGKYDLKQAIIDHNDKWRWKGKINDLLKDWFEAERYPNHELLDFIDTLRLSGVRVCVVTQQEKYRADFLKSDVLRDKYDDFFASCDFGLHKNSIEFWQEVLNRLHNPLPSDVIYFDDRPSLVELANSIGIDSFIYQSTEEVKDHFN